VGVPGGRAGAWKIIIALWLTLKQWKWHSFVSAIFMEREENSSKFAILRLSLYECKYRLETGMSDRERDQCDQMTLSKI
jgi:hypothetical protein